MKWVYDDGGRHKYFKGKYAGDCFVRAVSIATGYDYKFVYDTVNEIAKKEPKSKYRRDRSSSRDGVYQVTAKRVMRFFGWTWVPYTKHGHLLHLNPEELPKGTIICNCAKHVTCVIDGVIYDAYDCSNKDSNFFYRDGKKLKNHKDRVVYGYWIKENKK